MGDRDIYILDYRNYLTRITIFRDIWHVPSEHIYSDYPIKYKPKRSISPPPIDNRGLTTPTPPPSEPAPPIPDVIACGAAVRSSI
jgi:hypothetical protein